MFKNILVAVDGSKHAERAFEESVDLARSTGASLTAVTTFPEIAPWVLVGGYGAIVPAESLEGVHEQSRREHTRMLDELIERAGGDLPSKRSSSRDRRRRRSSSKPRPVATT